MKKKIIVGGITLAIIFLLAAGWILQTKLGTKLEKQLLKISGGPFTVYVYPAGSSQLVKIYHGKGYVWFEESKGEKRHTGVITFKTDEGKLVRIGAWGGVVIVEYQ